MQTVSEMISNNQPFYLKESLAYEPKVFRWTKKQYHHLAELGLFAGKRTEFLEGEIIEMPTMNTPHATGLTLTQTLLQVLFAQGFAIRGQMPLDFGEDYEPVPDIAIVRGTARDYIQAHPQTAELVVEIADSTISYDRNLKASLYAKNNIQDYWILNLKNRTLEIYRHPLPDENSHYGFNYSDKLTFSESDEVTPLAVPQAKIKVADLLP